MDTIPAIWPWVIRGAIGLGAYVLDKYDYENETNYDQNGNATGSTSKHTWNIAQPEGDSLSDTTNVIMTYENYEIPAFFDYELSSTNTNNSTERKIDKTKIKCKNMDHIVISDILNQRGPL